MSTLIKLIEKIIHNARSVDDISDIRKVLEHFGYREKTNTGSHCVFHKKGRLPITVPTIKGRKVLAVYVKKVADALDLERWYETNKEK
jgi:predicted RNA binding protein YcfA (HicA-like mRNA interferase family)